MNILIENAKVLLSSPDFHVEAASLYIAGGAIAGIGAPPAGFTADMIIDGRRRLVMPGLINSHTHLYMTLFRNYADDLPFEQWLFERLMPREDEMTAEDAYWCSLLGCLELISTGTTCFLDMHMHRHQSRLAAKEAGLRTVLSRGLVGAGPEDEGFLRRLEDMTEEWAFAAESGGLLDCMLAPHAIYSCGKPLLRHLADVARDRGLRVHIHVSETKNEVENCLRQHGKTPVAYLADCGLFDAPTVAAHCVHLTDEDIAILKEKNVTVATCPLSNMKLGNGFAPVPKLLAAGVNLALGTDGAASNNNLNLFKELAFLCTMHKGIAQDPTAVPATAGLRAATLGGARGLGLEGSIGSIAPGKRADLVLLDLDTPGLQPESDLVTALAYSASGHEVDTVLVEGNILYEDKKFTTLDAGRIYREVGKIAERLL